MESIQVHNATHPNIPLQGIVSLLRDVFPNSGHTAETFSWKHIENPAGPSIVAYATSSGSVIAFRAFWRFDLRQAETQVFAYQPGDSATAPQCRRRGYFRATTEAALDFARNEGVHLLFNFPNPRSLPTYQALGWKPQARLSRYVLPVRGGTFLRAAFNSPATSRATPLEPRSERCATAGSIDELLSSCDETAGGLNPHFSREILEWRLLKHPTRRYGVSDTTDGLILYRLKWRYGLRELEIVHFTGKRQALRPSVLLPLARKENIDFISIITPGTSPFRRPFFVRVPSTINFVALPLLPAERSLSWSFTPMYLDTV